MQGWDKVGTAPKGSGKMLCPEHAEVQQWAMRSGRAETLRKLARLAGIAQLPLNPKHEEVFL